MLPSPDRFLLSGIVKGSPAVGDDDTTVVVTPPIEPVAPAPPEPTAAELWYVEHERRHAEHMAHLESIREQMTGETLRLGEAIAAVDAALQTHIAECSSGGSLDEALDAVATVGETVADITTALNPEPEVDLASSPTPPGPSNDGSAGSTEVEPDVSTETAAPANTARRRGSRFW